MTERLTVRDRELVESVSILERIRNEAKREQSSLWLAINGLEAQAKKHEEAVRIADDERTVAIACGKKFHDDLKMVNRQCISLRQVC